MNGFVMPGFFGPPMPGLQNSQLIDNCDASIVKPIVKVLTLNPSCYRIAFPCFSMVGAVLS